MTRHHARMLLTALIVALFTGHATAAIIVTTADGTNGGDTYVQAGGSADTALGTTDPERARVRSQGSSFRKTYLRFDLAGIPHADDIGSTTSLSVFGFADDDLNPVRVELWGINDGVNGDGLGDWDEDTLTWNLSLANAQNVNNGTDVGAGATLLDFIDLEANPAPPTDEFTYSQGHEFRFSGTALANLITADTNDLVSFILVYSSTSPASGSSLGIATKENLSGVTFPTLNLQPVPVPVALPLGVLGLAGVAYVKRRRKAAADAVDPDAEPVAA